MRVGEPDFFFEPLRLAAGAARGLDADLPEETGDRSGAIHSRGIGPARAVGNRRMRADEQFPAGGGEVGGPDRDDLAAAGRRDQQTREHHGEAALGEKSFMGRRREIPPHPSQVPAGRSRCQ